MEEIKSCGEPVVKLKLKFLFLSAAKIKGVFRKEIVSIYESPSSGIAATARPARPSRTAAIAPAGSPVSTES